MDKHCQRDTFGANGVRGGMAPVKVEGQLKVVGEEKCCEAQASVTYAVLMGWAGGTGALVKGTLKVKKPCR